MTIEDNVVQFPDLIARGHRAMASYQAGFVKEAAGKRDQIAAVIEYGKVLLEGKRDGEEKRSNIAFGEWVSENKLDIGKPWDNRHERSEAMRIAEIVGRTGTTNAFDACPNTTPTNIMKWYREMHPETVKERPVPAPKPEAPKADKPKAERAAPTKPAPKPAPAQDDSKVKQSKSPKADIAYNAIVMWLSAGNTIPNQRKFADARRNVASHATFEIAFDRLKREQADKADTTANEDAALAKAEAGFSEKSKVTLDDAIRIYKAKLEKNFHQVVGEEVRRRIDAADQSVRDTLKKCQARLHVLELDATKRGVFTEAQFRQLQMICHPDSSASDATKSELLNVLIANKTRLVKVTK